MFEVGRKQLSIMRRNEAKRPDYVTLSLHD